MNTKNLDINLTDPKQIEALRPYFDGGELDLNALVIDIDTALLNEGYTPHQRPLHASLRISDMLGMKVNIGDENDKLIEIVHFVYESLYRMDDLYMPPMHIGTVMFRDIFLPIYIPVFYGTVAIDPVKSLHLVPENTVKWMLMNNESASTFIDQWIDLFDFVYGLDEISKGQDYSAKALEFWQLAKQQLEGAAATLLGSIDKYTVIQNSIISMELMLKGALLACAETEENLKRIGHRMDKLLEAACDYMPKADHDRLQLVINRTPALVTRRYEAKDYKRTELGQILMDAQFVSGEVVRQFSDRNARLTLTDSSSDTNAPQERYYPKLS